MEPKYASLRISESYLPAPDARKQLLGNKTKDLYSVVCDRSVNYSLPGPFLESKAGPILEIAEGMTETIEV